jgi:Tfp pilus assembly protein PilF
LSLTNPTEWEKDFSFYLTEKELADTVEAVDPVLLHSGSKAVAGTWIGLSGLLGAALGAVTVSPAIREPTSFAVYIVIAALLLRGFYPLTVRLLGKGVGWLAMFAFFWAAMLGLSVVLTAGIDTRWIAYAATVGSGAFVGMMYGSFPPGNTRNHDAWMLAFLIAPVSAFAATYVLRHSGAPEALGVVVAAGGLAGVVLMGSMGALFVRLWDPAQGLIELGQIYLHNEAFAPQAVAHLDRAIAMDPTNAQAYTLRGIGFSLMNEPDRAAADWEKASLLAPKDAEPHVHRGLDAIRRGAFQQAIHSLGAALQKAPQHARAHCFLGVAWEREGDLKKAFEHYDRAVTLAPRDARVYCERSSAYRRQGNHAKALQDAERAVRLEDHLGLAFAVRGHALKMLERSGEAMDSFQEAIELGVEPSVHQDVLVAMEALQEYEEHEERG